MKSIYFKTIICLLTFGLFVSCDDYLEEVPISDVLLSELDASNVTAITVAMYEPLTRSRGRAWESLHGTDLILLNESIGPRGGGSRGRVANYQLDGRNPATRRWWPQIYTAIGRANSVLDAIANQEGLDPEIAAQAGGEASFVRALCYWELVRFVGEVPMRLEPVTDPNETGQALSTIPEIYAQIITDLKFAESNLGPTTTRPGAATSGAAKVYLGDVYLTQGDYAGAAAKLKEVMDNQGTYGYGLTPNYADCFSGSAATHAGDVFSLKFSQSVGYGTFITTYWAPRTADYAPVMGIAPRGLERGGALARSPLIMGWDDADLRKSWSITAEYDYNGTMVPAPNGDDYEYIMSKYRDPGSVEETASGNDWPLYRYADVLLMYAEASNLATGGPSPAAYEALNRVRRRGYGVPIGTPDPAVDIPAGLSQADFDDIVFRESGYEFLGEGKRWYDIKRTERWDIITAAGWDLPTQLFAEIPDDELDRNDALNGGE